MEQVKHHLVHAWGIHAVVGANPNSKTYISEIWKPDTTDIGTKTQASQIRGKMQLPKLKVKIRMGLATHNQIQTAMYTCTLESETTHNGFFFSSSFHKIVVCT